MKRLIQFWPIFLLFIIPILLYSPSLGYGFSQDDFIHLSAARVQSFGEFVNFFNPLATFPAIFYYRPLGTQVYFFLIDTLFGLNPLPYHLAALFLHGLNTFLGFLLLQKLGFTKKISWITSLLYGISAVHFLSLYYISAFQEIIRSTFILGSLLAWFHYLTRNRLRWLGVSVGLFFGALLCKESALITPLWIIALLLLKSPPPKLNRQIWLSLFPFGLMIVLYGGLRIAGFQRTFSEGSYALTLAPSQILQNVKWYGLWLSGLPEIISQTPSLNPPVLTTFMNTLPFGGMVLGSFSFLAVSFLILVVTQRGVSLRFFITCLLTMLIPMLPTLFLSNHQYPHYLDLSLIPFILLGVHLLQTPRPLLKGLVVVVAISFMSLQISSLLLSQRTHWTTHRSEIASFYQQYFTQLDPLEANKPTQILVGDLVTTSEVSVALAKDFAYQVWFPLKKQTLLYRVDTPALQSDEQTAIHPITRY